MAKFVKCKGCNKDLLADEKYKISSKIYCFDCYTKKNSAKQSWDTLYKTICEYFEITNLTPLMLKQIKEYKEQYNYTDDGMTYTLWYCKEIRNKTFLSKYGVAIIKYEYKNAENYFLQQNKITNSANQYIEKTKYVTVNMERKRNGDKEYLINIAEVIGGV